MSADAPFLYFYQMIKQFAFIILFNMFSICVFSQQFVFNANCMKAYNHIIALRLEEGEKILRSEKISNPTNLMPLVLENNIDFFQCFISEDEQLFNQLQVNKEKRIRVLEKTKIESPEYLWSLASINIQWAFARMKFGQYYTAAFELRRAFIQLEENEKIYPEYLPNTLMLGLLHALVGSIPDEYHWIVSLAGMNGDVMQGIYEMKDVLDQCQKIEKYQHLQVETLFFLGFAQLNLLANPEESLTLLPYLNRADTTNLLLCFLKATIEMSTGQNDHAHKTLQNRPNGIDYYPFHYLDYLQAETMLRRLDTNASFNYSEFISSFKGMNYRQDAIRKLAWIALLKDNQEEYKDWMNQVEKQASGQVEADKQAVLEAKKQIIPNVDLLKARLSFDGGYYQSALLVMQKAEYLQKDSNLKLKMEYFYRLGRIYHGLKYFDNAIINYQYVIQLEENSTSYFVANASLKSGEIYEITGNTEKALECYQRCLKLQPDEYKSGVHLKAKAGVNRLTENLK